MITFAYYDLQYKIMVTTDPSHARLGDLIAFL